MAGRRRQTRCDKHFGIYSYRATRDLMERVSLAAEREVNVRFRLRGEAKRGA